MVFLCKIFQVFNIFKSDEKIIETLRSMILSLIRNSIDLRFPWPVANLTPCCTFQPNFGSNECFENNYHKDAHIETPEKDGNI